MADLSDIAPQGSPYLIDLVQVAGVDVSDWSNFRQGRTEDKGKASRNPKYCYEWAFVEKGKVVVINLWFSAIKEHNGKIFQNLNMCKTAHQYEGRIPAEAIWKKRALRMDHALQEAVKNNLPVRVIVQEGQKRGIDQPIDKASKVEKRMLDPVAWAVTKYDWQTGDCTVTRGTLPLHFVDQYTILSKPEEPEQPVKRRKASGQSFIRDREIRDSALRRANGQCEWCSSKGFEMPGGRIYLETHHVTPLSEGGPDNERNVVALCPNHHKEAHYGVNSPAMREELRKKLMKQV